MDPLVNNYCALFEVILKDQEDIPDLVLLKYGLLRFSPQEMDKIIILEMKRLYVEEKMTYREIAKLFDFSNSGVYRKLKKWEEDNVKEIILHQDEKKAYTLKCSLT
ncbi:hypothetical protein Amet_2117 [Alkaliphilus metalliredigens QYMF]|uniref:Uncharacterized protein n=1 Tax=Alkaliphilus metalliredigens (strain QYMF) TaxID=293826 RepID=A6TQ08_ALKMQ|nr:hypothetical protein [Alkaliphilus metalliredigens]ABR48276.1 hypothetical protein Amet_2117 [Alkaliphilus metalliredigens QYMF]